MFLLALEFWATVSAELCARGTGFPAFWTCYCFRFHGGSTVSAELHGAWHLSSTFGTCDGGLGGKTLSAAPTELVAGYVLESTFLTANHCLIWLRWSVLRWLHRLCEACSHGKSDSCSNSCTSGSAAWGKFGRGFFHILHHHGLLSNSRSEAPGFFRNFHTFKNAVDYFQSNPWFFQTAL